MLIDKLRQVIARFSAVLFGRQSVLFRYGVKFLLAKILRQVKTAHARDVKRLVYLRKVWIPGDDLLDALERRDISLLQLEILPRDLQIMERILLQIGIPQSGSIRPARNLRPHTRRTKNESHHAQANQ